MKPTGESRSEPEGYAGRQPTGGSRSEAPVIGELEAGVLRLAINRPERRNALNGEVVELLHRAFIEANTDDAVRVVTLTGEGEKAFCAGADLQATLAGGPGGGAFEPLAYRNLLLAIHRCSKPTIALARGHVVAGGMGLLLACDMALACDDVQLSTPEIQVGMFPMMVLALLARHVGRKRVAQMGFIGEPISAGTALAWGLLNQVYPRADFNDAAVAFVAKVATRSPAILQLGKEALVAVEDVALPEALEHLQAALGRVMATEDNKEGMRAFLEKRPPQWIGR